MKNEELRKKSNEELKQLLKDIDYDSVIASSQWSVNLKEKYKLKLKGTANKGEKTSLLKDLRRLKARVLTILNERGIKL
jgi:ribosomal protein L29